MAVNVHTGTESVDVVRLFNDNKEYVASLAVFSYIILYILMGFGGITFQAQPALAYDTCDTCTFDSECAEDETCGGCPPGACGGGCYSISMCHTLDCGEGQVAENHQCVCGDSDNDFYDDPACGGSDCDDTDPEKSPGNAEICDGKDNDCDGQVDENPDSICPDGETCESGLCEPVCDDSDGDGYTGPNCGDNDCDDSDSSVNPGASEVCDGKDNDCDGSVDESSEVCSGNDACSYDNTCSESGTTSQCIYDTNFGVYTCSDEVDSSCSRDTDGDTCNGGDGVCQDGTCVDITCHDDSDCPSDGACTYSGTCDETATQTTYSCVNAGTTDSYCDSSTQICDTRTCSGSCGSSCTAGTGVCENSGTIQCDGSCSASPGSPTEDPETSCSDGLDNDCDGDTDEEDSDCNTPPTADFDYSPTEPVETQDVDFDGSPSSDSDGSVSSYEWDWTSDGSYEDSGQTATHSFSPEGDHDVTLRVTDDDGATDTDTQTVNVQDGDLTVTADADQTPTSDPREEVIYTVSGNTEGVSCSASGAGVSWACSAGTCEPQGDMADGDHTVTVECTNVYGFSDSDDAPLTVDTTPPSVTCDECDFPDPVKSGEDVTFNPTLSDATTSVSSMEVCEDSGGSPDCTEIYCEDTGADPDSCSYTTPDDTFDTRDYWVRATDEVGNTASPVGPNSFTMKKEEGESCSSDEACLLGECGEDPETGQSVCEATVIPEPGIFLSFIR